MIDRIELKRLTTEHYAVGSFAIHDVTVTVGIYYHVDPTTRQAREDVEHLTHVARNVAEDALRLHGGNHAGVVRYVEMWMDEQFPGRPFYAETDEVGRGVQVYQPYGMPLEKPR